MPSENKNKQLPHCQYENLHVIRTIITPSHLTMKVGDRFRLVRDWKQVYNLDGKNVIVGNVPHPERNVNFVFDNKILNINFVNSPTHYAEIQSLKSIERTYLRVHVPIRVENGPPPGNFYKWWPHVYGEMVISII